MLLSEKKEKKEEGKPVSLAENVLIWVIKNLLEMNKEIEEIKDYKETVIALVQEASKLMLEKEDKE